MLNQIRINIFHCTQKNSTIFPFRISKSSYEHTLNLLRLHKNDQSHFVLIKTLGPLVNHVNNNGRQNHVCERCLYITVNLKAYNDHIELCKNHKAQRIRLPKFNDPSSKDKLSYISSNSDSKISSFETDLSFFATADLESLLQPVSPNNQGVKDLHIPISIVYKICSIDANFYTPPKIFVGSNVIPKFLDTLQMEATKIKKILMNRAPLVVTPAQQQILDGETSCHLCKQEIQPEEVWVVDHCHLTSVIRGTILFNVFYVKKYGGAQFHLVVCSQCPP